MPLLTAAGKENGGPDGRRNAVGRLALLAAPQLQSGKAKTNESQRAWFWNRGRAIEREVVVTNAGRIGIGDRDARNLFASGCAEAEEAVGCTGGNRAKQIARGAEEIYRELTSVDANDVKAEYVGCRTEKDGQGAFADLGA